MHPGIAVHRLGRCLGRLEQFFLSLLGFVLVVIFAGSARAQNTDTLILENGRKFTAIDQITDPAERDALLKIYKARSPRAKVDMAEAFLGKYPQSWLLPEVYEIAAKAYIDLGEFDRALQDGRASLQILPESPLLLVPLANAEVKLGRTAEAEQSAQDALDYLERFDGPSTVPKKHWPELQQELKSSCYFVLGRVRTSEGVNLQAGEERSRKLLESISLLARARSLNPDDPEIEYLIGLDYLALGSQNEAARWISVVYQRESPLKELALAKLRTIFGLSQRNPRQTFEDFLGALGQPGPLPSSSAPVGTPGKAELADYVGSKACAMCHPDIYQNWSHTGMARMLRPYAPENILGDFVENNVFYLGDEVIGDGQSYKFIQGKNRQTFARMIVDHGRHYFEIKQSDQSWHRYPVNYTIGSKWQQGYVTRLPNGQLQVFPIEYNARYRKWVNFWKIIDAPGTERDDPRLWEKFSPETNYKMNCAVCHTSQLTNTKGGGFQTENLEFREPGIGCEMCHGPGGKHVAWHVQGKAYEKDPLEPPVDFTRISSLESVAICSQCHMQSAIRAPGPEGELNYSRGPDAFFKRYKSRPYAEFFLNAHFQDGRFRQTSFIVESFLRSNCFRKGGATCISCHDPHHDDAASNPTSLLFRDEPNRMCTQCHAEFKDAANLQRHTRHPLNSEASQCASCHMPRIMDALMSRARTHSIGDIPNARMTEQFGQQQSPNACLICHDHKSMAWLDQQLETGWNVHSARSPIATLRSH
jgi:predicted CXXCH cytochrome family protein